MSIFKCPNCHDEPLPASEVPCWKCGSRKTQPMEFIDACGEQQRAIDAQAAERQDAAFVCGGCGKDRFFPISRYSTKYIGAILPDSGDDPLASPYRIECRFCHAVYEAVENQFRLVSLQGT